MVEKMRFELITFRLQTECSTVELNPLKWYPCRDLNPNQEIESLLSLPLDDRDVAGTNRLLTYLMRSTTALHMYCNGFTILTSQNWYTLLDSNQEPTG